jgi:hypothetical protein
VLPTTEAAPAGDFSARDVIAATYRFVLRHAGALIAAIYIPTALAASLLLVLFKTYFSLLSHYLDAPTSRLASLTVSVMAAGFFIWLLLTMMACASVARVVRRADTPSAARGWALEARLYAAVLRYLFVLFAAAILCEALVSFAHHFLLPRNPDYAALIVWPLFALFTVVFVVRCGVLLPALAVYERSHVLRRSWRFSRGHFWQFAAIGTAVMLLPFVVLQTLGEYLRLAFDDTVFPIGPRMWADAANMLAMNGAAIAIIALSLSVSIAVCLTLATVGSCLAYRRLAPA